MNLTTIHYSFLKLKRFVDHRSYLLTVHSYSVSSQDSSEDQSMDSDESMEPSVRGKREVPPLDSFHDVMGNVANDSSVPGKQGKEPLNKFTC